MGAVPGSLIKVLKARTQTKQILSRGLLKSHGKTAVKPRGRRLQHAKRASGAGRGHYHCDRLGARQGSLGFRTKVQEPSVFANDDN